MDTAVEKEPLYSVSPPALAICVASSHWSTLDANAFRLQHNVCKKEVFLWKGYSIILYNLSLFFFCLRSHSGNDLLWICYRIQKLLANQNPGLLCRNESGEEPGANHCQGGVSYLHFFGRLTMHIWHISSHIWHDNLLQRNLSFLQRKGFDTFRHSGVLSFTEDS